MGMGTQRKKILDFLKSQKHGVLSTADGSGHPHAALVAFTETDDFEIVIGTMHDTKKFTNLQSNPNVSFTVSTDRISVQYKGVARVLVGASEQHGRSLHLAKNPASKKYSSHGKQRYVKITPSWIRYSDYEASPEQIFEITF